MTRCRTLLLRVMVAAAGVVVPHMLPAQSGDLPALSPQCPDGVKPVMDTAIVTIGIGPSEKWKDARYSKQQRMRMRYYADGIRQHFVAPATLGELPVLGERLRTGKSDDGDRSVVSGALALIVTPAGRIATVAWEQVPISAPLAQAVARAVAKADSAGAFDGIPREERASDTLSLTISARTGALPRDGVPLLRARVAAFVVDRPPALAASVRPEYPPNAQRNFAENKATVAFIVGSLGRAYMPSFQVTRTDWADFEPPMRAAVGEST